MATVRESVVGHVRYGESRGDIERAVKELFIERGRGVGVGSLIDRSALDVRGSP
jgi:hypothetical protein